MKKVILFFWFLLQFVLITTSFAGEIETTPRAPNQSEKKELDVLLKTTEISSAEENEINRFALQTIELMKKVSNSDFDYSESSVQKLAEFIDKASPYNEQDAADISFMWGSYLGNALIKKYNGKWLVMGDGSYGVNLPSGHYLFPMKRAFKHMMNGQEDSIFAMYKSIEIISEQQKNRYRIHKIYVARVGRMSAALSAA